MRNNRLLPLVDKNNLRHVFIRGYAFSAPAKSGVGICNPEITIAHNTRLACFFVSHSHTLSMVGCMGAEQSAPGSIVTGIANPVQSATSEICNSSGGNIKPTIEDAAMLATTPTQNPLFVWRFFSCQQSTYHTVTATSEREARAQIPDAPCLFAARIRLEGLIMLKTFRINGRAVNRRGLTVGITQDVRATSDKEAVAEVIRLTTVKGFSHIRIVLVREVIYA
ncbi:host cell division inhibitor Icd-like protein [Salmonella enterica]